MMLKNVVISFSLIIAGINFITAQNVDESLVPEYTLPPILQTLSGEEVTTVESWESVRRSEILKLFEDHVYGQVPQDFDDLKFQVINEDKNALDGEATLREVDITVTRKQKSITIHLVMFLPNQVKKPVPTFLVINHRGMRTMDVTRKNKDIFWPAEQVVEAGYGIAGFDVIDVAPDDKEQYDSEVMQLYPEQQKMDNGMRALGAWGWGASRIIDYFETDADVDDSKIITVGHSRGGKASLWCGAQDQRVAIAVSNMSGNSGAALSRRMFGETVGAILRFTHWFCPNYNQYGGNENNLPVDQHMLLALMAPRAVYVSSAEEDLWADPKGEYLSLFEAQCTYDLYGFKTNLPEEPPAVNEQRIKLPLGYHKREGKHNMTPYDWQQFIQFANQYFDK